MRTLEVQRTVQAPRASVWAVLADYPNIADWNDGVIASRALGATTEGVGAQRMCELDGSVSMRETVTAWEPEATMAVDIDQIEKMPAQRASMTFDLSEHSAGTHITMRYDYVPKGGAGPGSGRPRRSRCCTDRGRLGGGGG